MAEPFTLNSQTMGCLPVLNHFLARIGLSRLLACYLPNDDARLRLAPAAVIGVAVANIVVGHRPVYALAEWAAGYQPGLLGLSDGDADALNDDRVGRMLDRLFDADRASLVTETILGVIGEFDVDLTQLHNDSTTITVTGAYPDADAPGPGRQGHRRDHPRTQQGLQTRPETAAVDPHGLRRRGGADRLPGR